MFTNITTQLVRLRKIIAITLTFFKIFQTVKPLLAKYPVKSYSRSFVRDLVLRLQNISNSLEKLTRGWAVKTSFTSEGNYDTVNASQNTEEKVAVNQEPILKAAPLKKNSKKPKVQSTSVRKTPSKTKKAAVKTAKVEVPLETNLKG